MAKSRAKKAAKTKAKATPKAKKAAPKTAKAAAHGKPIAKAKAPTGPVLRSLRSVICIVDDLGRAKDFYRGLLGRAPYFDQPFYVGFEVDGQELGLDPDTSSRKPGPGGAVGYWRVDDIAATWQHALELGARPVSLPNNVGGGIQVATVSDPFGNLIGLIQGA